MADGNLQILEWLLSSQISRDSIPTLEEWKIRFDSALRKWDNTIDRAAAGGFFSDRLAYAFAAGYQSALKRLIPSMPDGIFASFCITEEGGGHPAAIRTTLEQKGDGYLVNGSKRFITMADVADIFFVAASTGKKEDGKNMIRLVRIDKKNPGVTMEPMPELKFVPEVGHCVINFYDAAIKKSDILPGDGFTEYIRPFRTVEDLYVFAAVLGYLFHTATLFGWDKSMREQMLSLIVAIRGLATEDPSGTHVHIALGGLKQQFDKLLDFMEPLWENVDEVARMQWERDRALLKVAGNLRDKRLGKAWDKYTISK